MEMELMRERWSNEAKKIEHLLLTDDWIREMKKIEKSSEVSIAPTSRATCRICKTKIEKGDIRYSIVTGELNNYISYHHHIICIKSGMYDSIVKEYNDPTNIRGFSQLSISDKQIVMDIFDLIK